MFTSLTIFSEQFIVPALFVLLALSILVTFYYRPSEFEQTRIKVFLSCVGSIAVILVGLNLLVNSAALNYNQRFFQISKTKELIDKLWLYPNDLIRQAKHARAEFLAGFSVNNVEFYEIAKRQEAKDKEVTISALLEEQNIAIVIFQAWEDFLVARSFDKTGDRVWLNNFLQWAQNVHLKKYFEWLKHNYRLSTIELGNLLFEYAAKLPVPLKDSNLYDTTVEKMLKDPRLVRLLKEK